MFTLREPLKPFTDSVCALPVCKLLFNKKFSLLGDSCDKNTPEVFESSSIMTCGDRGDLSKLVSFNVKCNRV